MGKVIGIKKRREMDFIDSATGLEVTMRELYPGDELELKHSIYRLKPGVDFDDMRKAKESGAPMRTADFMEMDIARQQIEKIRRLIVKWNLTDEGGADLEPSYDNIRMLDAPLFALLEKWAGEIAGTAVKAEEAKQGKN